MAYKRYTWYRNIDEEGLESYDLKTGKTDRDPIVIITPNDLDEPLHTPLNAVLHYAILGAGNGPKNSPIYKRQ